MPRGVKKGTIRGPYKPTLDKALLRQGLLAYVAKHMDRMTRAQVANAIGVGHLFTRDKSGKFTRIENDDEVERLMTEGEENRDYWIFTKDPSVQAYTDLMNRALDKPAEQKHEIDLTVRGDAELVARLASARKRDK